jgi:hypothetical protein
MDHELQSSAPAAAGGQPASSPTSGEPPSAFAIHAGPSADSPFPVHAPPFDGLAAKTGGPATDGATANAQHAGAGHSAPARHGGGSHGNGHFARARNQEQFLALVREAERRLSAAGIDTQTALHILTSIYYGSTWSTDHRERERSSTIAADEADASFAQFTGSAFNQDPRPILGESLFDALQASQDLAGIDLAHMLIGMDARMSTSSQDMQTARPHTLLGMLAVDSVETHSTGAALVTWVGDLGGAAARVAQSRHLDGPRPTDVSERFRANGTDYGAPSNIAGDLLGMTAGGSGAPIAPGATIAETVAAALTVPSSQRARDFLTEIGGHFDDQNRLRNRDAMLNLMTDRIGRFAQFYIQAYDRSEEAQGLIPQAARDVATRFLTDLESSIASGPPSPTPSPAP